LATTVFGLVERNEAGAFLAVTFADFAGRRDLTAARVFTGAAFFFVTRLLEAEAELAFFAFLAGALPLAERLVIGFRRTDLLAKLRLLPVDVEDCREVERNGDLLTPLTIGLLMQSLRFRRNG